MLVQEEIYSCSECTGDCEICDTPQEYRGDCRTCVYMDCIDFGTGLVPVTSCRYFQTNDSPLPTWAVELISKCDVGVANLTFEGGLKISNVSGTVKDFKGCGTYKRRD